MTAAGQIITGGGGDSLCLEVPDPFPLEPTTLVINQLVNICFWGDTTLFPVLCQGLGVIDLNLRMRVVCEVDPVDGAGRFFAQVEYFGGFGGTIRARFNFVADPTPEGCPPVGVFYAFHSVDDGFFGGPPQVLVEANGTCEVN